MRPVLLLRAPHWRAAATSLGSSPSARHAKMPLRAKILDPAFSVSNRAQMASTTATANIPSELPEDDPDDVLFNSLYGLRTIELNRPKKLNSLNGSMARKIAPRLREWQKSDLANVIVIKGRSDRPSSSTDPTLTKRLLPKAFCAGGDVAALVKSLTTTDHQNTRQQAKDQARAFFALEYQLDHLIATYKKPYIAFMDGITMGGGAGLSVHAPFRIATERTIFAMPETGIGFFPDVGASFFLNRLTDGKVGMYLALTGESLKGIDVFYAGIATHFIHSSSLPDLEARLAELRFNDYDDLEERCKIIDSTIEEFHTGLPHDRPLLSPPTSPYDSFSSPSSTSNPQVLAGDLRNTLDRVFSHTSVSKILSALESESWSNHEDNTNNNSDPEQHSPQIAEWARNTLSTLHSRSPTSIRVALRQMLLGKKWSLAETFQREFLIATRFLDHPDFKEGVTKKLLEKPASQPRWASIPRETERENEYIDNFFRPVDSSIGRPRGRDGRISGRDERGTAQRLELWNSTDFKEPRFTKWLGLPSEDQVRDLVKEPPQEVFTMRSDRRRAKKAVGKTGIWAPRVVDEVKGTRASAEGLEEALEAIEETDGEDESSRAGKGGGVGRGRGSGESVESSGAGAGNGMAGGDEGGRGDVKRELTKEKVVEYFLRQRNGKVGVREKVEEILERKTRIVGDGVDEEGEARGPLEWVD